MQQRPLYEEFLDRTPPERFALTLRAYHAYIDGKFGGYSMRKMSVDISREMFPDTELAPDSHNLVAVSISPKPNGQYIAPRPNKVIAIVNIINAKVEAYQEWPVTEALKSAGYDGTKRSIAASRLMGKRIRIKELAQINDSFGGAIGKIGSGIYDIDAIRGHGFHDARSKKQFWWSSSMAIIRGRIPGYPLQQSDNDWVICQDASENPIDGAYALVRSKESPVDVRAIPKDDAIIGEHSVIVWLVAVMKFAEDTAH